MTRKKYDIEQVVALILTEYKALLMFCDPKQILKAAVFARSIAADTVQDPSLCDNDSTIVDLARLVQDVYAEVGPTITAMAMAKAGIHPKDIDAQRKFAIETNEDLDIFINLLAKKGEMS